MGRAAVFLVATTLFLAFAVAHPRAQEMPSRAALDATVAYNEKLSAIIIGYMDTLNDDALYEALGDLLDPEGDRERAVGVAQRELSRVSARLTELDAAYRDLPEPPANYLPPAASQFDGVMAYIDYLRTAAMDAQRTYYGEIAAVMRGDLADAVRLVQDEVEQMIVGLGAEIAFVRFQQVTMARDNPYRGLLEAVVLGNEMTRAYLSLTNRHDELDPADRQRLLGESVIWLGNLSNQLDRNDKSIARLCPQEPPSEVAMEQAVVRFCAALREANHLEREIEAVLKIYLEAASQLVAEGDVDFDEPRIRSADVRIGELVDERVAVQQIIVEQAAAAARLIVQ
ncbi:MAG: hypothetical protein AAGB11_10135 [Pseudomonadota bacterium]